MYQATVPVLRHYLSRIADMVALAGPDALEARLGESETARWQFETAAGLSMEIACTLAGRDLPDLPGALGPRLAVARAMLGALKPAEFLSDPAADLQFGATVLRAGDFVHLYGMPNFFFRISLGYAALVASGVALSEADFDGFSAPVLPDPFP